MGHISILAIRARDLATPFLTTVVLPKGEKDPCCEVVPTFLYLGKETLFAFLLAWEAYPKVKDDGDGKFSTRNREQIEYPEDAQQAAACRCGTLGRGAASMCKKGSPSSPRAFRRVDVFEGIHGTQKQGLHLRVLKIALQPLYNGLFPKFPWFRHRFERTGVVSS